MSHRGGHNKRGGGYSEGIVDRVKDTSQDNAFTSAGGSFFGLKLGGTVNRVGSSSQNKAEDSGSPNTTSSNSPASAPPPPSYKKFANNDTSTSANRGKELLNQLHAKAREEAEQEARKKNQKSNSGIMDRNKPVSGIMDRNDEQNKPPQQPQQPPQPPQEPVKTPQKNHDAPRELVAETNSIGHANQLDNSPPQTVISLTNAVGSTHSLATPGASILSQQQMAHLPIEAQARLLEAQLQALRQQQAQQSTANASSTPSNGSVSPTSLNRPNEINSNISSTASVPIGGSQEMFNPMQIGTKPIHPGMPLPLMPPPMPGYPGMPGAPAAFPQGFPNNFHHNFRPGFPAPGMPGPPGHPPLFPGQPGFPMPYPGAPYPAGPFPHAIPPQQALAKGELQPIPNGNQPHRKLTPAGFPDTFKSPMTGATPDLMPTIPASSRGGMPLQQGSSPLVRGPDTFRGGRGGRGRGGTPGPFDARVGASQAPYHDGRGRGGQMPPPHHHDPNKKFSIKHQTQQNPQMQMQVDQPKEAATRQPEAGAEEEKAEPEVLPGPPNPPDEELIQQMLRRYAEQDANCDAAYKISSPTSKNEAEKNADSDEDEEVASKKKNDVRYSIVKNAPALLNVDDAIKEIEANDVTFIVTDTGTGKSTMIPKRLMEDGAKVVSSQPRRTATINLALRVASLRNESLGPNVGYVVRGDRVGDENTRLMYMTSYTLLLFVLSHPENLGYTHFIIDEFHERQPEVEVLLVLMKLVRQRRPEEKFKIILMSASAEVNEWKSYFEDMSVGIYSTCNPRYPVYEYYLQEICRFTGAAYHPPDIQSSENAVVSSNSLQQALFLVKRMLEFLAKHGAPEHSVLVFLPGRTVVEQMSQFVLKNLHDTMEPIQWYRDVEPERIQAAFKRTGGLGKKKVYLATDIAEVSITLPDVVFVIDSATTKKPRIDVTQRSSVVFPSLSLLWTSRSALTQRKGRVGRVQQGFYFSMLPEEHLGHVLEMEPQIANSRIDELSLHVLQIASNPLAVFNLCRESCKEVSVQLSMSILVDSGCALPSSHPCARNEAIEHCDTASWKELVLSHPRNTLLRGINFETTVKGKLAQRLPLSVPCSLIVIAGLIFSLESVLCLAAAIIATGTPFYCWMEDQDDREAKKKALDAACSQMRHYAGKLPSDIIAALMVTLEYRIMSEEGLSEADEEQWCNERNVSRIRLQNVTKLEAQIKQQLGELVSFVDIQDPRELINKVTEDARTIIWLTASAFFDHAIFVEHDAATAQRKRKAGSSLFLSFDALCDFQVATCVNWRRGSVVLPMILQPRYDKLFGTFVNRLETWEFNTLLMLLAYAVFFDPESKNEGADGKACEPFLIMGIELHSRKMVMSVEEGLAKEILQFREAYTTRMRLQRKILVDKVSITDLDGLAATNEACGLPPTMDPTSLGSILGSTMTKIVTSSSTKGEDNQRHNRITPYFGPFRPTKISMLLSTQESVINFSPTSSRKQTHGSPAQSTSNVASPSSAAHSQFSPGPDTSNPAAAAATTEASPATPPSAARLTQASMQLMQNA